MNHRAIEDQQIVDLYLMKRLDLEKAHAFEAHYLNCKQCQHDILLTESFISGIRALDISEFEAIKEPGAWRNLAIAASILIASGLGYTAYNLNEASKPKHELAMLRASQASIVVMPLATTRGAKDSSANVIELSVSPQWYVFELEGIVKENTQYQIRLLQYDASAIWQQRTLPDYRGMLVIGLSSSVLKEGSYTIVTSPLDAEGDTQVYSLEVRDAPAY